MVAAWLDRLGGTFGPRIARNFISRIVQIYSGQAGQLNSILTSQPAVSTFGIPTGPGVTGSVDSNYNMMAAAYVSDSSLQSAIVTRIFNRANLTASGDMIPQVYNSSTGAITQGQFRQVHRI